MTNYQKPRGTNDWFFESIDEFNYAVDKLKEFASRFGFFEIKTPTFEQLELFTKNIGESTDVIKKEIYNFKDKKGRDLALRPEGTAGVIRAYVENKLYGNQTNVLKFFYIMNLFRYDRPQNGRFREFHQFGVEMIDTKTYLDTVECIAFGNYILKQFGIKNYKLKINNLGSFESREKWVQELKEYFRKNKDELSEDSVNRIEENPLRILDDKEDSLKDVVKNAPTLDKYLSDIEKQEFENITKLLTKLNIEFEIDKNLVRGLDYYTKTVFEFISTLDELSGATIIGGGNYSKLVKETGGPDVLGLGFGLGIERLIVALKQENLFGKPKKKKTLLVALEKYDEKSSTYPLELALKIREKGHKVYTLLEETKKAKIIRFAYEKNVDVIVWIDSDIYDKRSDIIIIETLKDGDKKYFNVNDL